MFQMLEQVIGQAVTDTTFYANLGGDLTGKSEPSNADNSCSGDTNADPLKKKGEVNIDKFC